MSKFKLLDVILNLFDGGAGASGAAGAAAGAGEGQAAAQGGSETKPSNTRKASKTGDLSNVVYGKPKTAADGSDAGNNEPGTHATSNTQEDKNAAFDALINGEYKDLFAKRVQGIIDRRFRETKGLQEQVTAQQPLIDALGQKLGLKDTSDIKKIAEALDKDTEFWSDLADQAGFPDVNTYKEFLRMKRENDQVAKIQQEQQGKQQAQQQLAKWLNEGEALKAVYTGFDLNEESKNPRFVAMLKSGVPVQNAYEAMHIDDIKAGLISKVAQTTEKKVVDNVRAKGARPAENGISSINSAVIYKPNVGQLSKADRAEIARRVARGETIDFK